MLPSQATMLQLMVKLLRGAIMLPSQATRLAGWDRISPGGVHAALLPPVLMQ